MPKSVKEVFVGKVDCTANLNLCKLNKVKGYPTMKFYRKGQASVEYDGDRNE